MHSLRLAALAALRWAILSAVLACAAPSHAAAYDVREVKQAALDEVKLQRAALSTYPTPPPAIIAALDAIIAALEASLRDPSGESRHLDHAHLLPPPEGTAAFQAGADAVALLGALPVSGGAFGAWRNGIAARLRSRLVEAHVYLADVALQEARGRSVLQAIPADVSAATEHLAAGRAAVELNSLDAAMQALKTSWQESIAATPPAPPKVGERPTVNVRGPGDGAILIDESSSVVAGMVGDIVAGTVDETVLTVVVNASAATERHRTYLAQGIPLVSGVNAIVAVVRDMSGNVASAASSVWMQAAPSVPTGPGLPPVNCACGIRYLAGNLQQAPIRTTLADPLSVRVLGGGGAPIAGMPVLFRVVEGDGSVAGSLRVVQTVTDSTGIASTTFTLGRRAGVGANRVRAIVPGVTGEVLFSAIADPAGPDRIAVLMGTNERAGVGSIVAGPVAAYVTDGGQNPVENVPVTFLVTKGNGLVNGVFEDTVWTNADGVADFRWTLGTTPGLDNNAVEATFIGLLRQPAVFVASGFVLGAPSETTVSGIVLDGQGLPVPGCTMSVVGAAATVETAEDGMFKILGVPVGPIKLHLDTSTTTRPGTWSSMTYDMITLPGVDNQLPRPIYILPLALADGEIANDTTDVVIDVSGVPGLSLTVPAGSAHFPGGGTTGLVSVTTVHADRIPMAPGSAMQPRTIVSIDPHEITFDPPAIFQVPNADGLEPGTVTEMFSFDHVLGMFVSIGTGTVSENGLTVRSDPGFGVLHGGWHCATPQSDVGQCEKLIVTLEPDVPWPVGEPIVILEGGVVDVTARANPSDNVLYGWEIGGDPGVISVISEGGGVCGVSDAYCPSVPSCGNQVRGEHVGFGTLTVTATSCETGHSSEPAVLNFVVARAEWLALEDPPGAILVPIDPDIPQDARHAFSEEPLADHVAHRSIIARFRPESFFSGRFVQWDFLPTRDNGVMPAGPPGPAARELLEAVPPWVLAPNPTITQALSEVDVAGVVKVRMNVPPTGFNTGRIMVQSNEFPYVQTTTAYFQNPAVVVLDPGHGGSPAETLSSSSWNNAMAVPSCTLEKTMTLDIARRIRDSLETLAPGWVDVTLTREVDENLAGASRAAFGGLAGTDVYLSLHWNANRSGAVLLVPPDCTCTVQPCWVNDVRHTVARVRTSTLVYNQQFNGEEDRNWAEYMIAAAARPPECPAASSSCTKGYATFVDEPMRNTVHSHPCRQALLELDFLTDLQTDVDFNTGPNAVANRTALANDMAAAIIDYIQAWPTPTQPTLPECPTDPEPAP